ncbi:hypothetical protein DL767_000738 [Monosporascus sp. MG133]|nr:hypothetical protein DL767_000738 [Monosporascus sp. MG133]
MSTISDFDTVLVPMQLDAFVLNPKVCGSGGESDKSARIAPITEPNYTFLRMENFLVQSDVQNHVDLHSTAPAEVNPRMTDLGARPPKFLDHRFGVYIHWTLPRFYRSGISSGLSVPPERRRQERMKRGLEVSMGDSGKNDTPDFVQPPTRWVVIREIDTDSILPEDALASFKDKKYQAWVLESDYLWSSLDQVPLDMDIQTDMAPFILGQEGSDVDIQEQAEVFIGRKTPLEEWSGTEDLNAQPPNISLLRSSNQLFADFQMHNANVFSMLDNFNYGPEKYLTYAKASYYVLGWHWKEDADPLWNSGKYVTHGASLDALFMDLLGVNQGPGNRDPWLDQKSQLRIICHGAMYGVTWDYKNKPKDVPADRFSERLRDQTVPAVSVGTTPMDALISYCSARKGRPDSPTDIAKLEEDILALESLLHARDDGVECQREAKDTIYTWSFKRSPGGTHYHFSGADEKPGMQSDTPPLKPSDKAVRKLRDLNQTQLLLDACNMTMQEYRWEMFSCWWKYVSDVGDKDDPQQNADFKRQSKDISNRITGLQSRIDKLETFKYEMLNPPAGSGNLLATAKPASMPAFYLANDPTVLIGGVESGWALDYLDKVAVRAPFEIISPKSGSGDLPQALTDLLTLMTGKLPDVFRSAAKSLVTEFYLIRPGGGDPGKADNGKFYPQFHDPHTTDGRWRDQWGGRQPWFPLYAEWEVEYTHIPFDWWKLDEHTARLSEKELARYGISVLPNGSDPPPPLWNALAEPHDTRVLSGRVLILPQPSFSLEAKVTQLFQNTPKKILNEALDEDKRNNLLKNMKKLSYLSSPLTGLTNGLVTQAQGSHIKPENKTVGPKGESSSVIGAAVFADAGLTKHNIELIEGNSALTPYAALVNFIDTGFCPFKPVTHGQFRFRKLNIIDKFGQALMAIDQAPREYGPPPLYPCISDFYEPQTISWKGQEYANTVTMQNPKLCEYLQLPPQINQNARLNACFVKRIADDPELVPVGAEAAPPTSPTAAGRTAKWRPANEWENPIWGWVITNYADYGIQLFLPDGTFYREVRFGGPKGALPEPKWIPFEPDKEGSTPDTAQLDALVNKLADKEYLRGFWHMITTAQDNLPPAITAYAQFLNSVVGKPLALVNMGWSLELCSPPLTIQSTTASATGPECKLTKPHEGDKSAYYEFQVRLGDEHSEYDGLVGYFDTVTPTSDELELKYINTFFAPKDPDEAMEPLRRLNTQNYPLFTAFWEAPFPTDPPYDNPSRYVDPAGFDDRRNAHMSVFGAVVDPFTAVHSYSSFLPPVALSLPPWTWQDAMNSMTAFLHAGPMTLPQPEVPPFDPTNVLTSKNSRDMPLRDLPLPALAAGDWSWIQPYAVPQQPQQQEGADSDPPRPKFNAFGIDKRGNLQTPGFQKGPYTAIEGFLQLRHPIMMPKPKLYTESKTA